ncbi:MAG: endonuclease [Comamonadaceae bacterium]|nr:MAG: endonuclease [Comamonadaceae bacterium]
MSLQDLQNNAIGILSNMPARTPEQVRLVLRTVLPLYPDLSATISEGQIEEAARQIEASLSISMSDASTIQVKFEQWLPSRRASLVPYYYDRYRRHLANRGFGSAVLGVLDKDTDKIVGLMHDPEKQGRWARRGLVVGHVQSGKTANYTGVICKAADYGYKFIVILTGIQEDLRVQTQERIEEGFTGISSEATTGRDSAIGVGLYGLEKRPICLTTRADDFRATTRDLGVSLQSLSEPLVLVMKKNSRTLANLIEWLEIRNRQAGARISSIPMLLIDDEADNASVNVSKNDDSPSAINDRIRQLLDSFDKNVYLGYTATPFANIFIDPVSKDAMEREDLFPRDFIISLDAPTNYVGASRIFPDSGDLHDTLTTVDDHIDLLPEKHKISHPLLQIPESLKEAVRTFVLARAIRLLRGQDKSHSSMLINASRFNDVQTKLTGLVADLMSTIRSACMGHAGLPEKEALRDPEMNRLHEAWRSQFEGRLPETWLDVQAVLVRAAGPIEVRKVNSKSPDKLDYRRYKNDGLHVIAIGGFALSRGFTLEGLTVSYFLRNSMMYDTLLQMGRWFGYRDGYADVCRIFMTEEAIDWYAHISEAIDELRDEFNRMERAGAQPIDFGLKVRAHPESLIVTARNKMRSGQKVNHSVSLSGKLIETTRLRTDAIAANRKVLSSLLTSLSGLCHPDQSNEFGYLWTDMPVAPLVRNFVNSFQNHDDVALITQAEPVNAYIKAREFDELARWDICLFSPSTGDKSSTSFGPFTPKPQSRSSIWKRSPAGIDYIAVSGKALRVGGRGQVKAGMSTDERSAAERAWGAASDIPDWQYIGHRTRPLLMLHVLDVWDKEKDKEKSNSPAESNVVAWGIAFPQSDHETTEVTYVVNTTWWAENYGSPQDDADEE